LTRLLVRPLAIAAVVALAACGGGGGGGGSATSPSDPGVVPTPAPIAGSAPIFNPQVLHEARLELDPSAWEELRRRYLSNQYYSANFSVDGVAVQQVGIRSRGSGSRDSGKPGIEIDFNRYVPSQEYYGYKRLVLDNLVQDPSLLRERLSFAVFEAMGIAAPRNAFAKLYVNGEYWGLYDLVEKVSKPFLKARLGEESGALFNYQWDGAWDFSWIGDDPSLYVPVPFEPETNETDPNVADPLVRFILAVNDAPNAAAIEPWLDTNRFLTHLAVENALAERDGILGDQGLNNFYLYQYGGKDRFVFIPWDKDSTFASGAWPLYRNLETNVLAAKLAADPAKRAYYADAVRRAVTTYVNARWLTPQLDSAWQQIRDAALADPHKPFTNGDLQSGVDGLRGVIGAREGDVQSQR
jgi:spore coat protein CotH